MRKIEIFSAGCPLCERTINMVKSISCPSCEIAVLDMHDEAISKKAHQYKIRTIPAVVIDRKLASCCSNTGPEIEVLRDAGIGHPL
jgi:glutaredoxin